MSGIAFPLISAYRSFQELLQVAPHILPVQGIFDNRLHVVQRVTSTQPFSLVHFFGQKDPHIQHTAGLHQRSRARCLCRARTFSGYRRYPASRSSVRNPLTEMGLIDGCWIIGLSTIGNISFGMVFVAGRNLVPAPATATIAFLIVGIVPIIFPFSCHVLRVLFSAALSAAGILTSTECSPRSSRSGIALSDCLTPSTVTLAALPLPGWSTVM